MEPITSGKNPKYGTFTGAAQDPAEQFSRSSAVSAFRSRDIEASRLEHQKARDHSEDHGGESSEYVKAMVFGGLDGMMTTFAIVNANAADGGNWAMALGLGFSNAVADAFSMGFGEFSGGSAEMDHAASERKRLEWGVANNKDVKIKEMTELYIGRGFPREDADEIIRIIAKNENVFVDFMMTDELGILVDLEDPWGPAKQGSVMFLSFIVFGSVPLIPYLSRRGEGIDIVFGMALLVTGIGLMVLGALKGYLTGINMLKSALIMVFNGAVTGTVSFVMSLIINDLLR